MRACLIIHSDKPTSTQEGNSGNGVSDFFSSLFSDAPVFQGNMFNDKFSVGSVFDLKNEVGTFAMTDPKGFKEIPVPSRGSMVVTCFDGTLSNKKEIDEFTSINDDNYFEEGFYPSKLMVRLNSFKHKDTFANEDESNYVDRVKHRVVDKMNGVFSFTLAYITLSGRSRLIIARKNRDIYFHIIYNSNFYAIVWTDEMEVFNSMDSKFFVYSMTPLYKKELLVIHPLYIINKWKNWRQRYKAQSGHLMAVSVMEKYLERISR